MEEKTLELCRNLVLANEAITSAISFMLRGGAYEDRLNDWSVGKNLREATQYLELAQKERVNLPELTEQEANLSRELHTYMRKYWDGPLSGILRNLISKDKGKFVWYTFIKEVNLKDKKRSYNYEVALEKSYETFNLFGLDDDEFTLLQSLRMWGEKDFVEAVDFLLENGI